jgi:hypothetical protein
LWSDLLDIVSVLSLGFYSHEWDQTQAEEVDQPFSENNAHSIPAGICSPGHTIDLKLPAMKILFVEKNWG